MSTVASLDKFENTIMSPRQRADVLLVGRGLFESRAKAQADTKTAGETIKTARTKAEDTLREARAAAQDETFKAREQFEKETKEENYHRIERSYGNFSRSFSIPATVDEEKIRADYKDGVLKIVLPKKEQAKPKQIKIATE